jgi:hypothetical protein
MLLAYTCSLFSEGTGLMLAAQQTASSDIFQACETIFGPQVTVSDDFLEYLHPVGLKTAYRKRALETHPDRAKVLGIFTRDLNAEFIDIRQAYEKLLLFVETKNNRNEKTPLFRDFRTQQSYTYHYSGKPSYKNTRSYRAGQKKSSCEQKHANKKHKTHSDHFYTGSIPKVNLMFGQFLYYSSLISWRNLIEAICWQRRLRPQIGQIAVSWGLISSQDLVQILNARKFNEKFGECALRIGYISSFEHFALVGKQRQLQRPFGEYFVESGILSSREIIITANKHQLHNLSVCGWK